MDLAVLEPEVRDYIITLEGNLKSLESKVQLLTEEVLIARHKQFGRSSEKIDFLTPLLFDEAELFKGKAPTPQEDTIAVPAHTRAKPGRKPLDPNLPRVDIIHDIPDEEKHCACGHDLVKIGEEVNERLQHIVERFWVERHIRPYYGCRKCEGSGEEDKKAIRIADLEPSLIPRSIVTPGLLSAILVNKFCDALPFYRQEERFSRMGISISRQDMSNWTIQAAKACEPIIKRLERELLKGRLIQMDETPLQVLGQTERPNTAKSYMWLSRGGPPGHRIILYRHRPTRAAKYAEEMLSEYEGYLQTDGYEAYEKAIEGKAIIHVGCWAHARRMFVDAAKATKQNGTAHEGVTWIGKLYAIEKSLREKLDNPKEVLSPEDFLSRRKAAVEPILHDFREWLERQSLRILPSALCGEAIRYTLNQWGKLVRYLDLAELTPDNNAAENAIRPFVLGRKNWLFSGSPAGADASCVIYSLIETAKANGLGPEGYLLTLFDRLPYARTEDDFRHLIPWKEAADIQTSFPIPPGLF